VQPGIVVPLSSAIAPFGRVPSVVRLTPDLRPGLMNAAPSELIWVEVFILLCLENSENADTGSSQRRRVWGALRQAQGRLSTPWMLRFAKHPLRSA
jgi:hypothetical protein